MLLAASQPIGHLDLITHYGYFMLIPLIVIEGPLAMFLGGFLVSLNYFDPLPAFLVAVGATVCGDALHYALGYWGGKGAIRRWGRRFGLNDERLTKLEVQFASRGSRLLLVSKIALGFSSLVLIAAGVVRYPFAKFNFWNMVGAVPKVLVFMILGYNFGTAYAQFSHYLRDASLIFSLIFIIGILILVLAQRYRRVIVNSIDK